MSAQRASRALPLVYLVERGPGPSSLDAALLRQALALGVEVRFGSRVQRLEGPGIVATGPKRADAVAAGYHFRTAMADGFWLVLDDALAPQGYAYLLVMNGQGTVKSCLFAGFEHQRSYVERTLARFRRLVGLEMQEMRFHAGVANIHLPTTALAGAHPLAGECAGFQDGLAGFGMRYALTSGHLAGLACATGDLDGYEAAYRRRIRPLIRAATVNRYLYGRAGTRGYRALVERVSGASDPRAWLRTHYAHHWWTSLIHPIARKYTARLQAAAAAHECREGCDCTYCRCVREAAGASTDDGAAGVEGARRGLREPPGLFDLLGRLRIVAGEALHHGVDGLVLLGGDADQAEERAGGLGGRRELRDDPLVERPGVQGPALALLEPEGPVEEARGGFLGAGEKGEKGEDRECAHDVHETAHGAHAPSRSCTATVPGARR